jgi:hypothetical protein
VAAHTHDLRPPWRETSREANWSRWIYISQRNGTRLQHCIVKKMDAEHLVDRLHNCLHQPTEQSVGIGNKLHYILFVYCTPTVWLCARARFNSIHSRTKQNEQTDGVCVSLNKRVGHKAAVAAECIIICAARKQKQSRAEWNFYEASRRQKRRRANISSGAMTICLCTRAHCLRSRKR